MTGTIGRRELLAALGGAAAAWRAHASRHFARDYSVWGESGFNLRVLVIGLVLRSVL
jgi:hypothetical protein